MSTIPKIIIQTWKTDHIPSKCIKYVNELKRLHPDYKYLYFTDDGILEFLNNNYPQYLETFNNFKYKIQKIDFFRYIAVYHYGGFYFDLDMDINKNIDELCNFECVFPIEFDKLNCKELNNFQIGQYTFGASIRNDFILNIITNIVNKKNQDLPIGRPPIENWQKKVYFTTGPSLVTQIYNEYNNKNSITLISPKPFIKFHFGIYGKHLLFGSWK